MTAVEVKPAVQKRIPLMLELAEPIVEDPAYTPTMGPMTKYKTYTGEVINGEKVWNYDYHDDD